MYTSNKKQAHIGCYLMANMRLLCVIVGVGYRNTAG